MKPLFFITPAFFRSWLEKYHDTETEVWVGFYKKALGKKGMNYDEALDEALCFGWIDGLVNKYDEVSYAQRFTPRRSKSVWSKINTQHIERLTKEGRMTPSGQAAVEAAKKDGRWEAAYDSPKNIVMPDDFLQELEKNKKAKQYFTTLNKSNTYAIAYRLQTARKPETRRKRISDIVAMLQKGEKFH